MLGRPLTHAFYPCCLLILVVCGCEIKSNTEHDSDSTRGSADQYPTIRLAVCDIDEIARELGLLGEMDRMLSNQKILFTNKIRKLQSQQQTLFNEKRKEFGEFPDDEQKQQLARFQVDASQQLRQITNQAQQGLAGIQKSLTDQIRTKIKKPIDKVATEKNIHVVLSDIQTLVLYTANVANITLDVLSAARSMELGRLEFESPVGENSRSNTQPLKAAPQGTPESGQ